VLLRTPFGRFALPECLVDRAVYLIGVHRVQTIADGGKTGLESYALSSDPGLCALFVLAEGSHDLSDDVCRHLQIFKRLAQSGGNVLFTEPRQVAGATIASASVVDVLLLLDIASEHAAIVGAVHQAAKGNVALRLSRTVVPRQNLLYPLEDCGINEERMSTAMAVPCPGKEADIELILEVDDTTDPLNLTGPPLRFASGCSISLHVMKTSTIPLCPTD
jgi:hypothetical protein